MRKSVLSPRLPLAALVLVTLVQPACSDDPTSPSPSGDNASGEGGGGQGGGAAPNGGSSITPNGGASITPNGGSGEAGAGEPGTGTNGGAAGASGGAPQAGAGGGKDEETASCDGELIAGECFSTPFLRVQSATRSAGSAVTMDTVKLLADTTAGNALLLGVGVVWNGASQPITVPAGFQLVERADNRTGASTHESAALYLAESAPALAAATGVSVTVADPQSRLYLSLVEYAGLRENGVLDRTSTQTGSGSPSFSTTEQTSYAAELWVVLTMSRGGGGHSLPTDGFQLTDFKNTGAGSFSLLEKLVTARDVATVSLSSSGDYAAVMATLRR